METLKPQSLGLIFSTGVPCEGPPGDTPTLGLRVGVAERRQEGENTLMTKASPSHKHLSAVAHREYWRLWPGNPVS